MRILSKRCAPTIAVALLTILAADASAQRPAQTPPCGSDVGPEVANLAPSSRCFELRTYRVQEGSSIDLLHRRFREKTLALFEKHGFTVVGFWQRLTEPNTLTYILAFPDGKARDAAWRAFFADPEWTATVRDMQVSVQVESVFMNATDYSPIK
jgi:NIPSNAP